MGNIYFSDSDYQKKTADIYATIKNNEVGGVIIAEINATPRDLTFVPRGTGKAAVSGRCNVETQPRGDMRDSVPKGVGFRGPMGLWFKGEYDNPNTPDDERYTVQPFGAVGTGKGTDTQIFFDPDEYLKSGCHRQGAGSQADEVLAHEMVHALRYMQGKSNQIPTANALYDNDEEFLAIVVANVYVSAKGGQLFRADHHSHDTLQPPLNTSAGFLTDQDNLKLMNIYRLTWSGTFDKLASLLKPQFNPFRELEQNLPSLSSNTTGEWRLDPPGTYKP